MELCEGADVDRSILERIRRKSREIQPTKAMIPERCHFVWKLEAASVSKVFVESFFVGFNGLAHLRQFKLSAYLCW